MADITTLTSQPKKEVRNPALINDPVFGGFELDSLYELVAKGQGEFVNQPEQISQVQEHKVEVGRFSPEGSVTGFQSPRGLIDTSPEARISSLEAEQFKVWREYIAKAPVGEKRVNINDLNKLHVSYEGSVDNEGNVTAYHQSEADKKQSENIALDIQNKREEKLAATRGPNRKSSKGALSGANDDLLLNTSANEGQSAVAQFSRGAG